MQETLSITRHFHVANIPPSTFLQESRLIRNKATLDTAPHLPNTNISQKTFSVNG